MINEKTVYEVNGKTFDNKADALAEETKASDEKVKEIAVKITSLLLTLQDLSKVDKNSSLCDISVEITDEDLKPRWYTTKEYSDVFCRFLKNQGINFNFFGGDEMQSAYIKIPVTGLKIIKIPSLEWLEHYIKATLKTIEKEQQDYLDRVMGRKS